MKNKVLVFFPHNPWPPRTGAHKRCLEVVSGLRDLGCQITFASSTFTTDAQWEDSSIKWLKTNLVHDVRVYEPTPADKRFRARLIKFYQPDYLAIPILRRLYPWGHRDPPLNTRLYSPPGMRQWFKALIEELAPDVLFMNYAYWDGLINHQRQKSVLRIIDTIDMVSLNRNMQKAVGKSLPVPLSVEGVAEDILQEDFFEKRFVSASADEFRIYDKYDYSIAITAEEAKLIRQHTHRTQVLHIPMTQAPCYLKNRYTDAALFPVGPNFFNTQGYLYFVNRVLPQVRQKVPSFSLQVTGSYNYVIPPEPVEGIVFTGFVPDLKTVYEVSRFVACPVFGGTGQQVKIVESMAHGVSVIALRPAAERSPLQHGVNGLVANDADEFANYVVQLWNDQEMCRRLGNAARETIATSFSSSALLPSLRQMIGQA